MSARFSSVVFLAGVGCAVAAACGENFITIQSSDAGLGSGSGGRVSGNFGGADDGGAASRGGAQGLNDAGAADASDASLSCSIDADCDDRDLCTGTETCVSGSCRAGAPLRCNDTNVCTTAACNPETGGCVFTILSNGTPCEDEDRCDGQRCNNGICISGPPTVCGEDNNPCTTHTCVQATGKCAPANVATGGSCSDGNACNGHETCANGVCQAATPLVCPADANPCTLGSCDPATGCSAPNGTACPDGNVCNGAETCTAGTCQPAAPLVCPDDANPCTTAACNPSTGGCVTTNLNATPCPDGNFCNGAELCVNGTCFPGFAACDDANPCTVDSCEEATDVCSNPAAGNGATCPDGDLCNGNETCLGTTCQAGTALVCAPLQCNPQTGCPP